MYLYNHVLNFLNIQIVLSIFISLIFIFVFFLVKSIISLDIFRLDNSDSSSSSSGSEDPSSDSSSGDPKRDSFWKKYWKIILGSVIVMGIGISAVIYYYYNKTISIEPDDLNTVYTIVRSNNYYCTLENSFVGFRNVVLSNPGNGQYAPFSIYWDPILRGRVSQDTYNTIRMVIETTCETKINIGHDNLVLTSEEFSVFMNMANTLEQEV